MKRGASQVDWIMSLVIFLIYLALFFVYIRPLTQPAQNTEALLADLKESFLDNASWSTNVVPLFINTNLTGKEPIIASFKLNWDYFAFKDNTSFELRDGKLFFIKTLKPGTNTYYIAHSDSSYPKPVEVLDLIASSGLAAVNSELFSAEMKNSILQRITYDAGVRLRSLTLALNDETITPEVETASTNTSSLLAEYKLETSVLNHSSFIMAGFPRIFNYVRLSQPLESHNLTISVVLGNYTSYYVTEADKGGLAYNKSTCFTRRTNYIDFYNSKNGFTIVTDDDANITNCQDEAGLSVQIDIALKNETRYDFLLHQGGFNTTKKYMSYYTSRTGLPENVSGLSIANVARINGTDYSVLKEQWNYPNARNFNFVLLNSSGGIVYKYAPVTPKAENVFVKEENMYVVDQYGDRHQHKLRLKGW